MVLIVQSAFILSVGIIEILHLILKVSLLRVGMPARIYSRLNLKVIQLSASALASSAEKQLFLIHSSSLAHLFQQSQNIPNIQNEACLYDT